MGDKFWTKLVTESGTWKFGARFKFDFIAISYTEIVRLNGWTLVINNRGTVAFNGVNDEKVEDVLHACH